MNQPMTYLVNPAASVCGPRNFKVGPAEIEKAVHRTRALVEKLSRFEVDVFALLGMRNLSSFVGEVFAAAMLLEHPNILRKNPHQDGYPDLLICDTVGAKEWQAQALRLREKAPFSPFATGGFEVKATCGSVPTPQQCANRNLTKPDMGEQRISLLTGYDWKAHHRETNYLFGLLWDFIDGCPTIVGVFYRGDLTVNDWGKIVQPKDGGGRTTSVSIMTKDGVRKMYEGWIAIIDLQSYATFVDGRNGGTLLSDARQRQR